MEITNSMELEDDYYEAICHTIKTTFHANEPVSDFDITQAYNQQMLRYCNQLVKSF